MYDFRFENLFFARKKKENDERTTWKCHRTFHDDGKIVSLLDVYSENTTLDVVVKRELQGWVRIGHTLERAYCAWEESGEGREGGREGEEGGR